MSIGTFSAYRTIVVEACWVCGTAFGMDATQRKLIIEHGKTFYCPNGDRLRYGKSEVETLRESLEQAQRQAIIARDAAKTAEKVAKRERTRRKNVERRVVSGVCAFCERHFTNLERHVATKHPEEKDAASR